MSMYEKSFADGPLGLPAVVLFISAALLALGGCAAGDGNAPDPPAAQEQSAPAPRAADTAGAPAAPPTATDRGRSVEERLADASAAARVRMALAEERQLRPFDFDPRVTGERVTLSGNVATRAQGAAAAEVAQAVEGIDEVRNRLTVDGQPIAWNQPPPSDEEGAPAAPPEAAAPGGQATGSSTYHTVRSGESLWTIADQYGTSVRRLKALNDLRADGVRAGERLLVARGTAGANETPPDDAEEAEAEYYVVKSGESLWAIARKNNMTVAHLKELNGLSGDRVVPGDRLRVD